MKKQNIEYETCEFCECEIYDIAYINGDLYETDESHDYLMLHQDCYVYACKSCREKILVEKIKENLCSSCESIRI